MVRFIRCSLIAALAMSLAAPVARAQWWPGWGGGSQYGRVGGAYAGQGELLKGVGTLQIDQEKARVEREAAEQAKLATQKKAFDQMLYERSLKPTMAGDQPFINNRIVSRMMTAPQPGEITSGTTLNTFMPYIMQLSNEGVQGPPIPVNQMALRRLSVSTGPNGPKIGVLRDMPLSWPMALRGPLQQKFDPLLRSAVSAATTDSLQPDQFKQIQSLTRQIEDDFLKRFRAEEVSTGDWMTATTFLESLKPAVTALGMPGVNRLLDGSMSAQGNNVPELVGNMTFTGLSFARGTPGTEAAYRSVHDSFVSYIRTAQSSHGIVPQFNPPDPRTAKR